MAPERQLGFVSTLGLVVASMIGSGAFTTSGFLLSELHTPGWVLAVWLIGGLMALLGALCYGALACRFPESGGEYLASTIARRLTESAVGLGTLLLGWLAWHLTRGKQ
jgi:APA family basic amino acid/polyamine antiporter